MNEIVATERPHARLGASSSSRWMNCPGSVALSEGLPDHVSQYAIEGTAAHEVLEHILTPGRKGVPSVVQVGEHTVPVTAEMEQAVRQAADWVLERMVEARESGDYAEVTLLLEEQFDLSPLQPPEPMFGTADVVIVKRWSDAEMDLHVIDYKHGQGVSVPAVGNTQLQMYALGAVVQQGRMPRSVTVTILQPRTSEQPWQRSWEFDVDELIRFKRELFDKAQAVVDGSHDLKAGSWCKFCKAKAGCPAQFELAQSTAMTEFAGELTAPGPTTLTGEQFAVVLERAKEVQEWLKAVEAEALRRSLAGDPIPGWKVVEGRAYRRWRDEEEAEKYLASRKLKKSERTQAKVISVAQAEKALRAAGDERGLARLEEFWEKPMGKPKLAPFSDSRPEVRSGAAFDFAGDLLSLDSPD